MIIDTNLRDDLYVLNQCTKYLARTNVDYRHNFGQYSNPADDRGRVSEAWRFPIVDSFYDPAAPDLGYSYNSVTFVYTQPDRPKNLEVSVTGSFSPRYQPLKLRQLQVLDEPSGIYALSVAIPKGKVHTYKFLVNDQPVVDPINPQQQIADNGRVWSRFFTHLCSNLITFERWEADVLERLTEHILPFRTKEGQRFLEYYYNYLGKTDKETQFARAYRFDQPVGVINFIDKILAKEEHHRLIDYRICLKIIDKVLRARVPLVAPCDMSKEEYIRIYEEMATDNVDGWDKNLYGSPKFFLKILRRHTYTGAFAHPKYGGNTGGLGWNYLRQNFATAAGNTAFDWGRSIEKPLGESDDYRG